MHRQSRLPSGKRDGEFRPAACRTCNPCVTHLTYEDEPLDGGRLLDRRSLCGRRLFHEHGHDGRKSQQPLSKEERGEDYGSKLRLHFSRPFVQPDAAAVRPVPTAKMPAYCFRTMPPCFTGESHLLHGREVHRATRHISRAPVSVSRRRDPKSKASFPKIEYN